MTSGGGDGIRFSKARQVTAAAALVLALLAPAVVTQPAFAAAPAGGPTTPGIWNYHTVTFRSLDVPIAAVQVADGGLAPRQPAPPAEDGVFDGWVTESGGQEVPFDFARTVITGDLVVDARFTDMRVVQFLAGPSGADARRIIDSDEVENGQPLGEIAPDVTQVPEGMVFTGEWYRQGDPTRAPYDFSSPVTENLHLIPIFAAGFAVSFVTDGTAVNPVFVIEPDTAFTASDLAAVPPPTRTGYSFTNWWADAARTQPVTLPITEPTTLYAGWVGESVEYHVSYWLEKSNVVADSYPSPVFTPAGGSIPAWGPSDGALSAAQIADPATYTFLDDVASTATAGTAVGGPTTKEALPPAIQDLVQAQLDPALVQSDPLAFADLAVSQQDVTVRGDGSTVVNVYLTRALWRIDFVLIAPGSSANVPARCNAAGTYDVTMDVGGTTYYQGTVPGDGQLLGTFSVREKIGFNMQAAGVAPVPLSQTDGSGMITAYDAGTVDQNCVLRGWGPLQITPETFTANYTGAGADVGSVNLAARTASMTGKMAAASTQVLTQRYDFVELLDQSQDAPDDVLGPDGVPNDPLHVSTLYNNDKTTVRAEVAPGHQVFSSYRTPWYWASVGDRQVAGVIDGFSSYVGYGTGANTQGNYFQLDPASGRLYQLNNSRNTNDRYRYQFYSRNTYALTFVTGGGTVIPPVQAIPYQGDLQTRAPADPSRGRDVFLGWFTDSEFNVPFRFEGATMPASNLVLYAKWLTDPHTVEFYDHPSSPDPIGNLTQTVEDQAAATSPGPLPPQPDGQTFVGWYQRTDDGYFVPYDFDTPVGSDLRLYARWQQPVGAPFTLTYDGDGNTGGTVPADPLGYDTGASAIVADGPSLTRGEEVFVGWRRPTMAVARIITSPVSLDGLYQAGRTVRFSGADVTLLAVYADPDPRFSVTFHENGGSDGTVVWDGPPGASVTYPDASDLGLSGPGTTFLGWATSPDAETADAAFDRLSLSTLTADVVLYAVWAAAPPTPPVPPTPSPSPSGEASGSLPSTGGDPWGTLLLGAALLAVGAAGVLIRRRRQGSA
ncbi:InlB B-repeat-containing protein [uncultured Microbacterium sp.]|uniref:InlB B-repeat-containing protein n=1 Tax=uncultured Microbacterium sp. TaxID=191216 RepID=UPI0025993704|nr:InlB B-repeat-containing protein [uncultured Microbacterium sp.]